MSLPSRVLNAGASPLVVISVCGEGADALSATGSSAGNALQLSSIINNVTTTPSGAGVMLPGCETGAEISVWNNGANALTVYGHGTDTIDGNASVSVASTKSRIFRGLSNTKWLSTSGA